MALALHSLGRMSFLQTRPLEGVEVSVVSEVPDLVELLQTTLRICGVDAVTAAARSAERPRLAADAQARRTVREASVTHIRFRVPSIVPAGFGLSIVGLLRSTDVRALCNAIHDAVVRP